MWILYSKRDVGIFSLWQYKSINLSFRCLSVPVSRLAPCQTERDPVMEKETKGDREEYIRLDLSLVWLMSLTAEVRPRSAVQPLSPRQHNSQQLIRADSLVNKMANRQRFFWQQMELQQETEPSVVQTATVIRCHVMGGAPLCYSRVLQMEIVKGS